MLDLWEREIGEVGKGAGELTSRSSFISSLGRDFVKVGLLKKAEIGGYVGIIGFSLPIVK